MKWWMAVAIVIKGVTSAQTSGGDLASALDLEMRNDAQVPADILAKSQDEVERIFSRAGIAVRWTGTLPRLTVHIVPYVLGYDRAASPVMGVALRSPHGATARIFYRRVQTFARFQNADLGTILAYVMAHEVGHVLMPGNAHSLTGVMQAEWDKALVRQATRGLLTFTGEQAARMRASN